MLNNDRWLLRTFSFMFSFALTVSRSFVDSSNAFKQFENSFQLLPRTGFYTSDVSKETLDNVYPEFKASFLQKNNDFKRSKNIIPPFTKKRKEYIRFEDNSDRLESLLQTLHSNVFIDVGNKRSPRPRPPPQNEFIYGSDERTKVPYSMIQRYPYFNVVRLSVGCTGTLLTPSYVLTAAHCVHDGRSFKKHMEMLKIYIPNGAGHRIFYARRITVPYMWLKSQMSSDSQRAAHDYSVIKLNMPVHGRRKFMPLQAPNSRHILKNLYFLGFDRSRSLLKSKCSDRNHFFNGRNVLLSQCDSSVGNSGASLFHENPRNGKRKMIGLVSNTANAKLSGGRWYPVTFITLLTRNKVTDICDMIAPEGSEFDICPSSSSSGFDNQYMYSSFFG